MARLPNLRSCHKDACSLNTPFPIIGEETEDTLNMHGPPTEFNKGLPKIIE